MPKQELFDNSISKQNRRDAQNAPTPQEKKKLAEETKQAEYAKRLTREKVTLMSKVDEVLAQAKGAVVGFKTIDDNFYGGTQTSNVEFDEKTTYQEADELRESVKYKDATFGREGYRNPNYLANSLVRDNELGLDIDENTSEVGKNARVKQESVYLGNVATGLHKVTHMVQIPHLQDPKSYMPNVTNIKTYSLNGLEISQEEFENLESIIKSKIEEAAISPIETDTSRYFEGLKFSAERAKKLDYIADYIKKYIYEGSETDIKDALDSFKYKIEHKYVRYDLPISDDDFIELYPEAMKKAQADVKDDVIAK